jgi:hypothetical protein
MQIAILRLSIFITETICPFGWDLHRQNCLKISEISLTFADAKAKGCTTGTLLESTDFGFWAEVPVYVGQIIVISLTVIFGLLRSYF